MAGCNKRSACAVRISGVAAFDDIRWTEQLTNELLAERGPACDCCGRSTIVQTIVVARTRLLSAPEPLGPFIGSALPADTIRHVPLLKMRVSSGWWSGPVWSDVGHLVVVDAPEACLAIVGPQGWRVDQGDGEIFEPISGRTSILWDVRVSYQICCCCCNSDNPPKLTDSAILDGEAYEFVAPPNAKTFTIYASAVPYDVQILSADGMTLWTQSGITTSVIAGPWPDGQILRVTGTGTFTAVWDV